LPSFSIIIVTYKRKDRLKALLLQLNELCQQTTKYIVVNGEALDQYTDLKNLCPHTHWLQGNFETPGMARNEALKKVSTDWVLFLDDDIVLPNDYFSSSFAAIENASKDTICIGGPDHSPLNGSIFQEALSLTLRSPMATAHTRLRHDRMTKEITQGHESNLILCHLWMRMDFQRKNKLFFSRHLFRNEENYLINQIIQHQGKALYSSKLFVYHYRKTRIDHLAQAVFSSGFHRVKSFSLSKKLFSFLFLIPAVWVVYLGLFTLGYASHHLLTMYITLTLFISMKVSMERGALLPLVIIYQILMNFFYGLGVLWGLLRLPFWLFFFKRNF